MKSFNVFEMYESYAKENNFIPSDKCLAFWQGKGNNDGAFSGARSVLSKKGFIFEKCENGWNVVSRPLLGKDFNFTEEQEKVIGRIVAKAVSQVTGKKYYSDKNSVLHEIGA